MSEWTPTYANMISLSPMDSARAHYEWCRRYFKATAADVEMVDLEPASGYGYQSRYRLNINTYLGWRVYMLVTGCLASKPEFGV